MLPFPDVEAILEVLVEHEVDFVVAGGVAVAYHGVLRATKDVDVIPAPDPENLGRLWAALLELDARPLALDDFQERELPIPFGLDALLNYGNWDLATSSGRLDLLQYLAGKLESADDYAALRGRAELVRYTFGEVAFVGFDDLLDLKNLAGRDQDLIDIRALREARGETAP